jgi:hypothetical protein
MRAKNLLVDMAITIPVTFVTAAIVTYVYSLIAHGTGVVNWETAFDLGFIIGIALPVANMAARRQK